MKSIGSSDLWDKIIDTYCDKEEKGIINGLSDTDYNQLEDKYADLIDIKLNKVSHLHAGCNIIK
jgi:hypothetical protein|tara:strand:+ start:27 stop:218 length:192 start_codon:yes stop_codon:yes gene_type:complete